MSILIDIYEESSTKGTGSSNQCLESATIGYALAKANFSFGSLADAKSKTAWNTAKKNKDVVVMFDVEATENTNTDPTYAESRTIKYETQAARKGKTFTHHLGLDSHSALKSYQNSGYTRIFEFTKDGYIKAVQGEDGSIKGQLLSNLTVGIRQDGTFDAMPTTTVELTYKDFNEFENNGVITQPDFDINAYEGIYPVTLSLVSATSSQIVVTATTGYEGLSVEGLALADFELLRTNGATQTISAVSDSGNTYTLTGSSLQSGTLGLKGVVEKTDIVYESDDLLTITI